MVRPKLLRSGHCQRDAHDRCPHFADVEIDTPWRRRPWAEHVLTLCICDCHTRCPLAGQETVTRATWLQQCACPGAGPVRDQQERAEQRRQDMSGVLAELRHEGHHPTSAEIEARLRAVFLDRGEPPPPAVAGWASVVAASQARRGTRTPRLLGMGLRGVARSVRWAWQPAHGIEAGNRAEARKLYGGVGVVALVAALLTATALRSSGWRRLASAGGAVVAWLATAWVTALGTVVTEISRFAEEHPASGDERTPPSP
jgi:hypothetical protein